MSLIINWVVVVLLKVLSSSEYTMSSGLKAFKSWLYDAIRKAIPGITFSDDSSVSSSLRCSLSRPTILLAPL